MAEAPADPAVKSVQELEQEITCGICHDYYQEPKVFPCCHYYCKQCIANLASRYRPNQPFPCPDCREPTLLPHNDPDKLPTAFFINRMKALHSRMEKAEGRVEALCEMCSSGDKSVAFCRQCTQFICEDCVRTHRKLKVFAGHKLSTLEELKQGGAKAFHQEEALLPKCATHDEAKKLYCYDCDQLICRDCVIIDHAGHKYEFVKTAAPETRKKLTVQVAPLKEIASNLRRTVDKVNTTRKAIEANGKSVAAEINLYFDKLQKILNERRQQLLDESLKIVKEKVENLSAQEKNITLSLATVQSLTDFVERSLANATDEEVVSMQTQVLSRIDGEMEKQKHGTATQNLDSVEAADCGVVLSSPEDLREFCSVKIRAFTGIEPQKCTVEGEGVKLAEVDKAVSVTVSTYYPSNRPARAIADVNGELRSLVDNSVVGLQGICLTNSHKYTLQYTPKVRGRHQLSIRVNGGHILGSPFSVFVRIQPTKLGKPVKVMEIPKARYIAFNSSGEVIVTKYNQGIDILDKNGTKLHSITLADHGMKTAEGVAVDQDDNLYVTDRSEHCLVKFNSGLKLLKKLEGKVGYLNMNSPIGVAVHDERVLVCDNGNSRVVILNRDLEFIKEFGHRGSGNSQFINLHGIATDTQGRVYVSDRGNRRVQVFTIEGGYIQTIGLDTKLRSPTGLCVDKCYLYIVSYDNRYVVVYNKEGQYVSNFGELPPAPYGISMNRDGLLFVCCCCYSSKIVVL